MITEVFLDERCRAAFLGRVPGVDVAVEREAALARLAGHRRRALEELELGEMPLITAEQVHGNGVALISENPPAAPLPGIDALITDTPGVCLGIYVADCCAVYAWDAEHAALGLAHSGKKGTELRIVPAMLRAMERHFGTNPAKTTIALSPCIRPPFYEVDFAQEIIRQCQELGVREIHPPRANTAENLGEYYSYRAEKGRTGRMLAVGAIL